MLQNMFRMCAFNELPSSLISPSSLPPDVCSVLLYSLNSLTSEYSSNAACSMQGGLEGVYCLSFI